MSNRDLKLVAQYKQKEQKRLADYVLNQMSEIECGLNPDSIGRNPYDGNGELVNKDIWIPSTKEIAELSTSLHELRSNILSSEEREVLHEQEG